jgi:predicted lipoprotein with Yx(FWY)xxD motif
VAVLAGCGSSNSTSSSTTAPAAANAAAATAPASPPSRYGAASTRSATTAGSTASTATVSAKHSKLGTILAAGPKSMTVYLFEGDSAAKSACAGACEQAWPPLRTGAAPHASGAATSSQLGTITRADGTKQVTYNGHPLYFFSKDGDAGDAYGQGVKAFGADWYVVAPSGAKIDSGESHGSKGGGGGAS